MLRLRSRQGLPEVSRQLLPPPIAQAIRAGGYNRLLVLPWGGIAAMPFPALQLGEAGLLAEQAAVVMLPDIDALLALATPLGTPPPPPARFRLAEALSGHQLVVGNPAYAPFAGEPLPDLPGAGAEAKAVAALLGASRVLRGDEATHAAVLAELDQVRGRGGLVYLATHGVSSDANPMDESFIALSVQHLNGTEIRTRVRLGGSTLVVLSACQSGLGKSFGGGAFGIARALHGVGAGQVVGSLWNVSDDGTLALMRDFAERLGQPGASAEEALREAALATRTRFDDPAIWAAFLLFGNPSE